MKKILFIHGLGSSSNSSTVKLLKKNYSQHAEWHAIDVYCDPDISMQLINDYIKNNDIDILVGTSMGGFYILCTEFNGPKIVVNPVLYPGIDLAQMLGIHEYTNPRNNPDEELYEFTIDDLNDFSKYSIKVTPKTYMFISDHDQILSDYRKEAENYVTNKLHIHQTSVIGHVINKKFIEREFYPFLEKML